MEYPDPEEEQHQGSQLQPCPICGRTFRPDALSRHQGVCEKNASKKRKVFDSSKQRAPEDEQRAAPHHKTTNHHKTTHNHKTTNNHKTTHNHKEQGKGARNNWREKHEELIKTIKQARGQEETEQKKVPSDYVECGGCGRHFNQRAAERHVPWCQERNAAANRANNSEHHAKLIARVRYRPPQGKSRSRKSNSTESEEANRKSLLHSSPPALLDNRNSNKLDRINNNVATTKKRSVSRERALVKSQPEPVFSHHIIKFKDKFPNHITKRNCLDLEESLTCEQLRDLLSVSRIERGPKTVPGVRLSGGRHNKSTSDVSRSSSSSGGSSNSWEGPKKGSSSLPEVSSSEQLPWTAKPCWDGDLGSSSFPEEFVPLTFYCHQCGSKFPLVGAKYCCECGAKRRGMGRVGQPTPTG